jgi:hypothetical protein
MPSTLQRSSPGPSFLCAAVLLAVIVGPISAQAPVDVPSEAPARVHELPPLRQQAEEIRSWNLVRMETVLPQLMREYGVDMWVLSMREYAEDPVFFSFKDPTSFAARRRSIYVFFDRGADEGIERLALGGGSQGGIFTAFRSTARRMLPRAEMRRVNWLATSSGNFFANSSRSVIRPTSLSTSTRFRRSVTACTRVSAKLWSGPWGRSIVPA